MSALGEESRRSDMLPPPIAPGSTSSTNPGVSSITTEKSRYSDIIAPIPGARSSSPANITWPTLEEHLQLAFALPTVSSQPITPSALRQPELSTMSHLDPIDQQQLAEAIARRRASAARLALVTAQHEYANAVRRMLIVQKEIASSNNRPLPRIHPYVPLTLDKDPHRDTAMDVSFAGHSAVPCSSDPHLEAVRSCSNLSEQGNSSGISNPEYVHKDKDALALQSPSRLFSSSANTEAAEAPVQKKRRVEPASNRSLVPCQAEEEKCHNSNKKRIILTGIIHQEKKATMNRKPMAAPSSSGEIKKIPPEDLPRRPLNAYNFFFSEEREKILNLRGCGEEGESTNSEEPPPMKDVPADQPWHAIPLMQKLAKQHRSKKRRPHRKTHGKIGFKDLTKLVASRWRNLPSERVKHYKELARMDLKRYEAEIEWWTSRGFTLSHDKK